MEKLSVTILTFNEEENIERCLYSVRVIADEILIIDSFSTDRTVEIAESLGAKVIQNKFEGFIEQRRFCIQNAKHNFILALDCDECLDEELTKIIVKIKKNPPAGAFQLNRLSAVGKQFVYHGNWHPDWKLRLFFRSFVTVAGTPPHDSIEPHDDVKVQKLKGKLLHYSDKTRDDRITAVEKHSTAAALSLFSKKQKSSIFRLYLKPVFRFFSGYFLKGGFLDGSLGLFIAKSEAQYVFLREQKLQHLWRQKKSLPHD